MVEAFKLHLQQLTEVKDVKEAVNNFAEKMGEMWQKIGKVIYTKFIG